MARKLHLRKCLQAHELWDYGTFCPLVLRRVEEPPRGEGEKNLMGGTGNPMAKASVRLRSVR